MKAQELEGLGAISVIGHAGCKACRPERELLGRTDLMSGPAGLALTDALKTYDGMEPATKTLERVGGIAWRYPSKTDKFSAGATSGPGEDGRKNAARKSYVREGGQEAEAGFYNQVAHIIEEPGKIQNMIDCEVPTEYYYEKLFAELERKHPNASAWVKEHVRALEPFLDVSIVSGFSFGVNKAFVCRTSGGLLGHQVSRSGASTDPERIQAIVDFPPLKDASQVRQFIGSTNWVRRYLTPMYAAAAKTLGEYIKPRAEFPNKGLGAEGQRSEGDKAVLAVKAMCKHAIETAVFDEAAALDGSRPLEQVADACGIAWGGTLLQMSPDLASFKVLGMFGKSFNESQQAWPPLVLEGFAQLETKRA